MMATLSSVLYLILLLLIFVSYTACRLSAPELLGKYARKPQECKYKYETRYITQPLQQLALVDHGTFSQRYLISMDHWAGAQRMGPIFMYIGNEGDIEWFATYSAGFLWDIAPRFGAMLLFAEITDHWLEYHILFGQHRYYGESMPYGSKDEAYKNSSTLRYLSAAQAIADFSVLIMDLKHNLSAKDCPVVLFGGSYGGMLAVWMRLKEPLLSIGVLASSAPILQFDDIVPPETFYDRVSNDFRRESTSCFNTIKESWDVIASEGQNSDGLVQLTKKFRLCRELKSVRTLSDWLSSAYRYLAMANYPYPSDFLMPLPGNPIKEVCRRIDGAPDGISVLERIYYGINVYYNYTGDVNCFELDDYPHALSAWQWQACTQMIMPMSSDPKDSMFPTFSYNYTYEEERCWRLYGVKPRPRMIVEQYGGHDLDKTLSGFGCNIIFSNGLLDPWSGGSVLKNISETIVALATEEGAHVLDLQSSTPNDPQWLIEQREAEIRFIQGWIKEYNQEKTSTFSM